jgi:hypothetical protein
MSAHGFRNARLRFDVACVIGVGDDARVDVIEAAF